MFAPQKILVPSDFSRFSDGALRKAVDIARQNKAKIHLLHVVDEAIHQCAVDYCLAEDVVKSLEADSFRISREKLQQEADAIKEKDQVEISFDVVRGVPYEVILEEQRSKGFDLIVIASHGRTGILKHLIGSVTDKVIRGASCPVLVVKPEAGM
jgi:universal stress protein A